MTNESFEKDVTKLIAMLVWLLIIAFWPILMAFGMPMLFFDYHHEAMGGLQEQDVNSMISFVKESLLLSSLPATVSFLTLAIICLVRVFRRNVCNPMEPKRDVGIL
jgi:hypothetical protein